MAAAAAITAASNSGKRTWQGFSAVSHAVLERLLGEGDVDAADARASLQPTATVIADVRHVTGFECPAVPESLAREAAAIVACMRRRLQAAGCGASQLAQEQLERAEVYLRASRAARQQLDGSYFEAWYRIVAADLDKLEPTICVSVKDDEREEKAARAELAAIMAECVVLAGGCTEEARAKWRTAAASEVRWRDEQESGRGLMRVVLRAWREVCDGQRDTTAASLWQEQGQRLPTPAHPRQQLGSRLSFGTRAANLHQTGISTRVLLEWQRLVRAASIRRRRAACTGAPGQAAHHAAARRMPPVHAGPLTASDQQPPRGAPPAPQPALHQQSHHQQRQSFHGAAHVHGRQPSPTAMAIAGPSRRGDADAIDDACADNLLPLQQQDARICIDAEQYGEDIAHAVQNAKPAHDDNKAALDGDAQIIDVEMRNNSEHDAAVDAAAETSNSGEAARASAQGKSATCFREKFERRADDADWSEIDEDPEAGDDVAKAPRRVRTDRVLILRPIARRRMLTWVDGRFDSARLPFGDG